MNDSNSGGGCQSPQPPNESLGVVYKITCLVNGKPYIGQTRQKLNRRMSGHKRSKVKRGIDAAIEKYGWENFTVEVIETCPVEQLNEREKFWIAELNSKDPNGYNLTDGGSGTNPSDETRAKISASNKGKHSQNKGKPLTEEHKAKIAVARKAWWAKKKLESQNQS